MMKKATFAMGCFWGPDTLFGCMPAVVRTRVGYCGGTSINPTYKNIGDHTESIDIDYDPEKISYNELLQYFWKHHDPTITYKLQYRSAIFYHDEEQKQLAEESRTKEQEKLKTRPIVTAILPFKKFYNAEGYHQKYYLQTFHKSLYDSLSSSQKDLFMSTVAARLNGYITGQGTLEMFEKELSSLGLNNEQAEYVRKQIKRPSYAACH